MKLQQLKGKKKTQYIYNTQGWVQRKVNCGERPFPLFSSWLSIQHLLVPLPQTQLATEARYGPQAMRIWPEASRREQDQEWLSQGRDKQSQWTREEWEELRGRGKERKKWFSFKKFPGIILDPFSWAPTLHTIPQQLVLILQHIPTHQPLLPSPMHHHHPVGTVS